MSQLSGAILLVIYHHVCRLFLDELPEFGSTLIELLRQPLEGNPREVSISSAKQRPLSARAFPRILKLTRIIADLAEEENIQPAHPAEALQYRLRN